MQSARLGIAIAIASIICLLATAPDAWAQRRTGSKRQAQKQKSAPKPQGIEAEAKAEADNLLNMFFTRCGDSYYHYVYDHTRVVVLVEEWRGFHIRLLPNSASAADRLNGIEWRNGVGFSSDARRQYRFSEASWSKWLNNPNLILLYVAKVDGKWLVNGGEVPDYKRNWDGSISDLWMRHLGGKIPPDRKVRCENITAPVNP